MIDARIAFLLLTALLLSILVAVAVATFRKSRRQKLEDPKYRMLEDD